MPSRYEVLGGSGSPPEPIGETIEAFSTATPPTSPAVASANHLAMVTKLADDEWFENIFAEGYSTVIDGRMCFKLSVDAVSRMLLRSLAHVGLERDATVRTRGTHDCMLSVQPSKFSSSTVMLMRRPLHRSSSKLCLFLWHAAARVSTQRCRASLGTCRAHTGRLRN